ncbi:MAG: hypothetical protein ACYDEX_12690 [Mobilitalea sp.]
MYWTFYNPVNKMINYQNYNSFFHAQNTFKAFVDAIVPRTPRLAEEYGKIQFFGALDQATDEYMVLSLNNYYIPLAEPTADMLDIAGEQLMLYEGNNGMTASFPRWGKFAALSPIDRFRVLSLLEEFAIYLVNLPMPFQANPIFSVSITSDLIRLAMMGYYSEWYGYGSTRLMEPNKRKLEFFPLSWKQVGYPGPSLGYRALREVF